MEYHKDNEEKSTHSDSLQRVPVAEKGRADLWGRWSRSRAPSGGLPLGCDGSARHRGVDGGFSGAEGLIQMLNLDDG